MKEDEAKTKECRVGGIDTRHPYCGHLDWPVCSGSGCGHWVFDGDGFEKIRTNNLTADQSTMMERIKSHPSELSIWQTPVGEPSCPVGDGWEKDGDMRQARGYSDGCFEQHWKRRIEFSGHCGLAGKS